MIKKKKKKKKIALKDIQKDASKTWPMQDKGSRFIALDSDRYIKKIGCQLERSSFQQLDYNKKHFLHSDGTAPGPHMSCSYSNIAIQYFDVIALEYAPATICWKRFRDDIFIVWPHSTDELDILFDYINKVDSTKKIQFTMEVATDTLEFLDLKLKFNKKSKRKSVDVFYTFSP